VTCCPGCLIGFTRIAELKVYSTRFLAGLSVTTPMDDISPPQFTAMD
jgi:hypothetical protein